MASFPGKINHAIAALVVILLLVVILDVGDMAWMPLSQGGLMSLLIGLIFLIPGIDGIVNPRLGRARDLGMINSDEVGPAERFGARLLGTLLVLLSLAWIGLAVASVM